MITMFDNGDTAIPCTYRAGKDRAPVDISGATIRAQIRRKVTDPSPLVDLSTENGAIRIVDGAAGRFQIDIAGGAVADALGTEAALVNLPMDVVLTKSGGRPVNLGRTHVAFYRGVTR